MPYTGAVELNDVKLPMTGSRNSVDRGRRWVDHYGLAMVDDGHWVSWHRAYEDPNSSISRRLAAVQRRLGQAMDAAPAGPIRLVSMCAGQGRDVIGVLAVHARREDVKARLVELDPALVDDARTLAIHSGLLDLEFCQDDASTTAAYIDAVPADIVLVCGVFGNITDSDVRRTVDELPGLVAPGATVIWTRHRLDPDLTPSIRSWFSQNGFEEVGFDTEEGSFFGVGTHRFVGTPRTFEPGRMLFNFRGDGSGARL